MTLAILQARTASTRMPGKVMAPVLGEPMIWRQLERIRRARSVSKVVVATSTASSDDALAAFLLGRGCTVYRGEHDDVLDRFAACAAAFAAERVVRVKADCPLVDPQLIDAAIALSARSGAAYTSNCEIRSYPHGLEVEVIAAEALAIVAREAMASEDRAHVTTYLRRFPLRFEQAHLVAPVDRSALRWTVDRPEDFAFVREVYQRLYPENPDFGLQEIVELLEAYPALADLASRAIDAAA
jgi:spore coat polysaccharide biosynthesis protein SpsF